MPSPPWPTTLRPQPLPLLGHIRRVLRRPTAVGGDIAVVVLWHAAAATARVFVFERGSGGAAGRRVPWFGGGVRGANRLLTAGVLGLGVEVVGAPGAVARG